MRKLTSSALADVSVAWVLILPAARVTAKQPSTTSSTPFDLPSVEISPDGRSVVVETTRPDWTANRFRSDLWLYREASDGQPGRLAS